MESKEYEVTYSFSGTFSVKVKAENEAQAQDYVFDLHKQGQLFDLFRESDEHDSECSIVEVKSLEHAAT